MGARDRYETVTRVIQAFATQRTWCQAELARHVGVQVRALRGLLSGLIASGMPLEKMEEHPHVYWSVPKYWFPAGVIFDIEDWQVLVHALLHIADSGHRGRLLRRLLAGCHTPAAAEGHVERLSRAVAATPITSEDHEKILLVEQSLLEQFPLRIHYYSAGRKELGWRTISVQRLITEPHGRIVAFCHSNRALRWFRVDNIQSACLDKDHSREEVPASDVDAFVTNSVDGYHDGTSEESAFRVRSPESGWVRNNLLAGMSIDGREASGEIRVVARGAVLVVARYIVGLGGAGVAEGDQLRALVRQLAEAAREANRA